MAHRHLHVPRTWFRRACCGLAILAVVAQGRAEESARPFLHPLFSDHAVLQRDMPLPVWGWTTPGAAVKVTLADAAGKPLAAAEANADADGRWLVRLPAVAAGTGPLALTAAGPQTVTVQDVLAGDVWLCSGQSNMEWSVRAARDADQEIAAADFPQIRLFTVPKKIAGAPLPLPVGAAAWQPCTPQTVPHFSAVGFFFGRTLHQELQVPIGLINASWGGTIAEAWTSAEALRQQLPDDFGPALDQVAADYARQKDGAFDLGKEMGAWWTANDPGSAATPNWAAGELPVEDWKPMPLPGAWEAKGMPFDGIAWFRREVDLPAEWDGKPLVLSLGRIDDRDTTFVNGTEVGATQDANTPRKYKVPAGVFKPGRNVIAVRILDLGNAGGFIGKPEELQLTVDGDTSVLPLFLDGDWLCRASTTRAALKPVPQPFGNHPNLPSVLYNGMVAPLLPAAIKGAIWYQGESNAGRAKQYQTLLPTLIRDWRARFSGGEFAFGIVQLANFMKVTDQPVESGWAELREAQFLTAKNVPNTGLALAIDIGDAGDIHPRNKQEVGRRLALWMLGAVYGKPGATSGPLYDGMAVEGDKIRVRFTHTDGSLTATGGGPLKWFAVAGADGKFVAADATIDGETVLVSSPAVPAPAAVRYAWANNPEGANLCNGAGLPAAPFRSDVP